MSPLRQLAGLDFRLDASGDSIDIRLLFFCLFKFI